MAGNNFWKTAALILGTALVVSLFFNLAISPEKKNKLSESGARVLPAASESKSGSKKEGAELENAVLPPKAELPAVWGDLGKKLAELGVIDKEKIELIYSRRGGVTKEMRRLLEADDNGRIVMNKDNAAFWLNLLWAFGLANKNPVLEGEMQNPQYGGAGNFASTGGWTAAKGSAMNYYNRYRLVKLTPEQEKLVAEVAANIYRPCCGNPTSFPDCNHGMAMLGLLELMAARGAGEDEMYRGALAANSYWFPDTYLTIAKYLQNRGVKWSEASPKGILSADYSSALGFRQILAEVQPSQRRSGGGCGV